MIHKEHQNAETPSSNTGVTNIKENPLQASNGGAYSENSQMEKFPRFNLSDYVFDSPKYDWFAGSVKGIVKGYSLDGKPKYERIEPKEYLNSIIKYLGDKGIHIDYVHDTALLGRFINKKALFVCQGYGYSYHLMQATESILSISYGGHNGKNSLYLSTTGQGCSKVFHHLQDYLHNLQASRVDACYDTIKDFMKLKYRITEYCRKNGLKYRVDGQGIDSDGNRTGETLYIDLTAGKRIRIYEKGYERLSQLPDIDVPLDWVRFEIQCNGDIANNEQGKVLLAHSSPEDILTIDKHCTALYNRFTGKRKESSMLKLNVKKISNEDKFLKNLNNQYGNLLRDLLETDDGFNKLMQTLYPNPQEIPSYLRSAAFDYIEENNHLKHGEY